MVEEFTTLPDKPDDRSAGEAGLGQGTFARHATAVVSGHKFGIGLGIVGLLIGGIVGSPLLAVIGFLGGFGAGSTLFDARKNSTTPVSQEVAADQGSSRGSGRTPSQMVNYRGEGSKVPPFTMADVDFKTGTASPDVTFDASFSDAHPDIRPPTGYKARKRSTELG